jgi:hypothetical protein
VGRGRALLRGGLSRLERAVDRLGETVRVAE